MCCAYDYTRIVNNASVSEYARFLNGLGIQIYKSYAGLRIEGSTENTRHDSKYATGSEYGMVLNVPNSKMPKSFSPFPLVQNFLFY